MSRSELAAIGYDAVDFELASTPHANSSVISVDWMPFVCYDFPLECSSSSAAACSE